MDAIHGSSAVCDKFFGLWTQRWQTDIGNENSAAEHIASSDSFAQPQHPHDVGRREGQPVWQWGKRRGAEDDFGDEGQLGTCNMSHGHHRGTLKGASCSEASHPDDVLSCWICLDVGEVSSLIAPCTTCCGSLKLVHQKCITSWIRLKQQAPEQSDALTYKPHCPNCKTAYAPDVFFNTPSGWKISRSRSNGIRKMISRMPSIRVTTTVTTGINTSRNGTITTSRSVSSLSEVSSRLPAGGGSSGRASEAVLIISQPRMLVRQQSVTYEPIEVVTVTPSSRGSGLR